MTILSLRNQRPELKDLSSELLLKVLDLALLYDVGFRFDDFLSEGVLIDDKQSSTWS
jgi:hypothetical protein